MKEEKQRGWPEGVALLLFAGIQCAAIPRHEPWSDEAQAWELARSLPLGDLFHRYIRYEATPGLWHGLLWLLSRLRMSYTGLHWMCGAIALLSAAVLVLASPLPRWQRLTLPFTYFFVFQYAVIARSYVLAPLLLFLIAWSWKKRPLPASFLLGLLGNLSLHAAMISGGLGMVLLWEGMRGLREGARRRREVVACTLVLLGLYAFALWTAWPPKDLMVGYFRGHQRAVLIWAVVSLLTGTSQPWLLAAGFWIAIVLWLKARRSLRLMLPVVLFAAFSGAVYVQLWHMGLLTPLVVAALWISQPEQEGGKAVIAGNTAMAALIAVQLLWAGYVLRFDFTRTFSGDPAAARFLEPYAARHATIAVTAVQNTAGNAFDAVGIEPYFDSNIFANWRYPFWWWSESNDSERQFDTLLPKHPEIVLVETRLLPGEKTNWNDPGYLRLRDAGYVPTHSFCGTIPNRFEESFTSCHLIFERTEQSP